jgi:hypothetical protein
MHEIAKWGSPPRRFGAVSDGAEWNSASMFPLVQTGDRSWIFHVIGDRAFAFVTLRTIGL